MITKLESTYRSKPVTDLENFLEMLRHANIVPSVLAGDGATIVSFDKDGHEVRFLFDGSLAKQLNSVKVAPVQ
jgi:hypothetical protein